MKEISQVVPQLLPTSQPKGAAAGGNDFMDFLAQAVAEVNRAQQTSDRAVEQLHSGQAQNLHEIMIAMEEADISLRLMVQMRNKLVEAYQEIMRMQV